MFDTLIRDVRVLDGSGQAEYRASVALEGGRIAAIGELPGAQARHLVDGDGLALAPGFIDVHTHDDTNVIRTPGMLPKLSQGVTTVVVGRHQRLARSLRGEPPDPMNLLGAREDFSYPSFADYTRAIEAAQPAVNVAALVGHRPAQQPHGPAGPQRHDEVLAMREQLREALAHGAIGLSTGLARLGHRGRHRGGRAGRGAGRVRRALHHAPALGVRRHPGSHAGSVRHRPARARAGGGLAPEMRRRRQLGPHEGSAVQAGKRRQDAARATAIPIPPARPRWT